MRTLATLTAAFALAASGCGEKWLAADAAADVAAVHAEVRVEQLCAPDAGTCDPAMVRALLRAPICDHAANLAHHGEAVPDVGAVQCLPK